jgi:hypothetical protein
MTGNARINPNSGRKKVLPIVAGETQFFNADGLFLGNRFNVFQIYNDGSAALYVGTDNNIGVNGENSLGLVVPAGAAVFAIVGGADSLYMRSAANGAVRIFYFYEENLTSNQLYQNLATVIINSGLATDVTLVAELPAGTQEIGKVGLVAGTATVGSVKLTDGTTVAAVDDHDGALVVIDQNHHEVHEGHAYKVFQSSASLANNGTFLFELITGTAVPHMKAVRAFTNGTSGKLEIIEAPTITDGNAALTPQNRRRTGTPPASGVTVYSNPTSISAGTILAEFYFTGKAEFTADQLEMILKAGTKYLYRFTNTSGGAAVCSAELFWYE